MIMPMRQVGMSNGLPSSNPNTIATMIIGFHPSFKPVVVAAKTPAAANVGT